MKITPVHPGTPLPEHNMPFVPAFSVEGGRTLWLAGMGPVPIYHRHPHDPGPTEAQWYEGGFRVQCERTFENIERILAAAGADLTNIVKMTQYLTHVMRRPGRAQRDHPWELFGRRAHAAPHAARGADAGARGHAAGDRRGRPRFPSARTAKCRLIRSARDDPMDGAMPITVSPLSEAIGARRSRVWI